MDVMLHFYFYEIFQFILSILGWIIIYKKKFDSSLSFPTKLTWIKNKIFVTTKTFCSSQSHFADIIIKAGELKFDTFSDVRVP